MLFGGQTQSFPAPVSNIDILVGNTDLYFSPFALLTIGAVLVMMLVLFIVFQRTTLGLRMRAAAFNPEIARILGIRVGRMLTIGWGLAALLGALAGMLTAPAIFLYPTNMDEVLVFGFTGAIIGGLDSPVGAVVGALAGRTRAQLRERLHRLRPGAARWSRHPDRRAHGPSAGTVHVRAAAAGMSDSVSTSPEYTAEVLPDDDDERVRGAFRESTLLRHGLFFLVLAGVLLVLTSFVFDAVHQLQRRRDRDLRNLSRGAHRAHRYQRAGVPRSRRAHDDRRVHDVGAPATQSRICR